MSLFNFYKKCDSLTSEVMVYKIYSLWETIQVHLATLKRFWIDLLLNFTMAMTYTWLQQNYGSVQVYSNTRVPTQVNTSQHESDASQHESTRVNKSLTRVNTSLARVNTSPTQVNMSPKQVNTNQHKSKSVLDELTLVNTSPTRV